MLLFLTVSITSIELCAAYVKPPARQYYSTNQNSNYRELVKKYKSENEKDPTLELFTHTLLITVDNLIIIAPNQYDSQYWWNCQKTIQKRVVLLKQLEQESHDREKTLHNKVDIFRTLRTTYQQEDHGYTYFKNEMVIPLQELIQLKITSQDIPPKTIKKDLDELATCQLTDSMHQWLKKQNEIVTKQLEIANNMQQQYATKGTEQSERYYQIRSGLYQELLNTYQYHTIGQIPARLKSELTNLELAQSFETLRAENPDDYNKLMSLANTLARTYPQNKEYAECATHYTALFELNALNQQRGTTDFTDDQTYNTLTTRIKILKPLMKSPDQRERLCFFEKDTIAEKESIDSWLNALQQTNLWNGKKTDELCAQLPSGSLPKPVKQTISTAQSFSKYLEAIASIREVINSFKEQLSILNTIHPFSVNDHEEHTQLTDAMCQFVSSYRLSPPTELTTSDIATHLLMEQKNDLVRMVSIQQIQARPKTPQASPALIKKADEQPRPAVYQSVFMDFVLSGEEPKPEVFQSFSMDSLFVDPSDEKPTVRFYDDGENLLKGITQSFND